MPRTRTLQTIVIGAGQAGLAMSRTLQRHDVRHVVLEKGQIGESWCSGRWKSFVLNTPNQTLRLPDAKPPGPPDAFLSRHQFVKWLRSYQQQFDLPVLEKHPVTDVVHDNGWFTVQEQRNTWRSETLVVCTGDQNQPVLPDFVGRLAVPSLHVCRYRSPEALPPGAILVMGSGQSGVQVTEDLLAAGRDVWLSTSMVGRAVRRYRGRDVIQWFRDTGLYEDRTDELSPDQRLLLKQPQFSGVEGGRTVSLHSLARQGAKLIGRIEDADGNTLKVAGDLEINARWGDDFSAQVKAMIDGHIAREGIDAPRPAPDTAEAPSPLTLKHSGLRELKLDDVGVSTVIFATGFSGHFGFLPSEWLTASDLPVHQRGVGPVPGLYYLGLSWLRNRGSGLILGINEDARAIGELVTQHLASRCATVPHEA